MAPVRHLRMIRTRLRQRARGRRVRAYAVPGLWLREDAAAHRLRKVDPFAFFAGSIDRILRQRPVRIRRTRGGAWTSGAVVYNMFVRTSAAFDHDQNGKLDLPVNEAGWRETGTFLKAL